MTQVKRIYNGKLVTPEKVIENQTLIIAENKIIGMESDSNDFGPNDIDAKGAWVIPGLVDSHSDAIEVEMQPRPTSQFPIEISFYELEKKLISEGITTIYHSLSLRDNTKKNWVRQDDTIRYIIDGIKKMREQQYLISHKIHLRYEITHIAGVPFVTDLINNQLIDQLSFMDHTPGQGQFRDIENHLRVLVDHRHYTEEQALKHIQERQNRKQVDEQTLQALADLATIHNIPLASHDDDSIEKIDIIHNWGAVISEFPIGLDVAYAAKEKGLAVVMGAPNVLLGKSHSNNLSAKHAIEHGVVDILCSDYYPSSLLHAVFHLYHDGLNIADAVKMVTLNPAKALRIDQQKGSIERGKDADLLIIREYENRPILEKVIVEGKLACEINYQKKHGDNTLASLKENYEVNS